MGRKAMGAGVTAALMAMAGTGAAAGPPSIPSALRLPPFHKGAVVTVRWTPLGVDAWTVGSSARGYVVQAFEGAPDGVPEATAEAGEAAGSATLAGLVDGRTYTIQVRSRETVGVDPVLSAAAETTTTIDATAPTGTLAIDGGAAYTRDLTVTLGFAPVDPAPDGGLASGVTRVQLSQSGPDFACPAVSLACPSPFSVLQPFTLTDGPDGPRTVWAAFHDAARAGVSSSGNVSPTVSATILLDRRPPAAAPAVPAAATAGVPITMSGAASADGTGSEADSGVDPAGYAWEFGDGGAARGAEVTHAYAAPGTYSGRLRVSDRAGNTGSSTFTVTVAGASTAPPDGDTAGGGGATTGGGSLFRAVRVVGTARAGRRVGLRVVLLRAARVQVRVYRPRAGRAPRLVRTVRIGRPLARGVTVVRIAGLRRGAYVVRLTSGGQRRDVPLRVR